VPPDITVRFQKRAHNRLLMAAGFAEINLPVPWLGRKRLQLVGKPPSDRASRC